MNCLQFLSWLAKEMIPGVIITWCSVFSAFGQGVHSAGMSQNLIDSGSMPRVFMQDGVSIPTHEQAPSFTPDGNTVYFAVNETIFFSKKINGKWNRPVVASFSSQWGNWDPSLSPDGKHVVFVSDRPLAGMPQGKPQKSDHLWYVDRLSGDEWSKPRHLDAPVNLDGVSNYGPSISSSGTICFCSRGRDGNTGMCGYYAKLLLPGGTRGTGGSIARARHRGKPRARTLKESFQPGGHYDKPKLLALNGTNDVYDPFIAPDESYIIFVSGKDLYISYRNGDTWSVGQKLGWQVNNGNANHDPYVSPDGKMLYYSENHALGILMIPVNIPKRQPLKFN